MKTLIGFNGKKRSGKDTSGNYLSEITGIQTYAFADPLKQICSELFLLTEEETYGDNKEIVRNFHLDSWKDNLTLQFETILRPLLDKVTISEVHNLFYKKVLLPNLVGENEVKGTALIKTSPRRLLQLFGTDFIGSIDSKCWVDLGKEQYNRLGALIITDVRFDSEAEWIREEGGIVVSLLRKEVENSGDNHASEAGISNDLIDVKIQNDGNLEELKNAIEVLKEYKLSSSVLSSDKLF